MGILGCGRQGTAHLELAAEVFPDLRRAVQFDRHPDRAETLAAAHPRLEIEVTSTAEGIAAEADVVITTAAIVRSPDRPIRREHLAGATVACAVDFDATLADDLFDGAALFVVDDVPQYRYYREQGYFAGYPDDPIELCDALDPAATHLPGLRVLVPLGIALEDVAVAAEINRRASEAGLARSCRSSRSAASPCAPPPRARATARRTPGRPRAAGPTPRSRRRRREPARPGGGAG